jgi:dipeptidase
MSLRWTLLPLLVVMLVTFSAPRARACTSILVAKGASRDASTFITYSADSHELYGSLAVRPAATYAAGTMLDIFDGETGKLLGQIEQAPQTFAVVGLMNEKQVSMSETTFEGRKELQDPLGIIDYESLMLLALQRAGTARRAIQVMTELVGKYGYASTGESFSIADPNEVWLLELIGKGPGRTGAVWVARRLPEGMISAHANQARIHQFPLNDSQNVLYAADAISFAREKGYFTGKDDAFSFADAYAPMDFQALRFCEARVWNVFRRAAPSLKLTSDYVLNKDNAKPLPLWVKPDKALAVPDVVALMRDHFEDTPLDFSKDLGAGPFHLPYRWRPLTWKVDGVEYFNERSISTQQTGYSFIAQARSRMPDQVGGLLWFGLDDTYSTVYVPIYSSIRSSPPSFAPGVASLRRFSWSSAFWVFNAVANLAYTRYEDVIKDVQVVQRDLEGELWARQAQIEQAALKLFADSPEAARDYLTQYSHAQAERTVARWRTLWEELFAKYMDGNVKDELGAVTHPPLPEDWYRRIVKDEPGRYALLRVKGEPEPTTPIAVSGYFHSKSELGALAANVPADFPFSRERLVLLSGGDRCARPPACCLTPAVDALGTKLVVTVPKPESDRCGGPAWLIRLPVDESRPLVKPGREP